MKVYLNSIEKELSFSIKKIIKIHFAYWNIYIIRILQFWLVFSVFLLIYSLEKNCYGVTEWQDIPLKSWENFDQTVRILARFHKNRGRFYCTILGVRWFVKFWTWGRLNCCVWKTFLLSLTRRSAEFSYSQIFRHIYTLQLSATVCLWTR